MNKALNLFVLSLAALPATGSSQEQHLAPLDPSAMEAEQRHMFEYLAGEDMDGKRPINMLGTIAHHPELLKVFLPWATQLGAATSLPARELELLALRTSWRARSEYEWVHHFDYGLKAGLTEAELGSIAEEIPSGRWSEDDRLLFRVADELVARPQLKKSTMQDLLASYSPKLVVEIIFIVNQYNSLSKFANSVGVALEPGYQD